MPIPRGTAKSDKKRAYENQYDADNYKVAACKIKKDDYKKFKAFAEAQGKTVSALLLEYVRSCIGE